MTDRFNTVAEMFTKSSAYKKQLVKEVRELLKLYRCNAIQVGGSYWVEPSLTHLGVFNPEEHNFPVVDAFIQRSQEDELFKQELKQCLDKLVAYDTGALVEVALAIHREQSIDPILCTDELMPYIRLLNKRKLKETLYATDHTH